jgi:hypothetical protein
MIICRKDATKTARNAATMSHIQAGFVGESPGPPPAGTALGNPPEGSLPPVITGAGVVLTVTDGDVMVSVGAGDVVMGAGDVVMGAGDVVMGAGDVVMGAGDVVIGVGVGLTVVTVGVGVGVIGAGDVVIGVGVGLAVVSVGVGVGLAVVSVGVGVGLAVVSVGVGDGLTVLQPAFKIAWPAASQLSPSKFTPDLESLKGGMMSPQATSIPSEYTGPS